MTGMASPKWVILAPTEPADNDFAWTSPRRVLQASDDNPRLANLVVEIQMPLQGGGWDDAAHWHAKLHSLLRGQGSPELGNVSIFELAEFRGWADLPIERDLYFEANKTLSAYAEEANLPGRIVA